MSNGQGPDLAIDVSDLSVNFGRVEALKGISLGVKKGEIFGVVGTNGAGKSTLIDVLSGMVKPSSGTVRVLGMDPIRQAGRLRKIIGVVPQEIILEEKLTAQENLEYFGRLLDVPGRDLKGKVEEMIRFMGLWERKDDLVESYSVGMKKKVHFSCSLIHSPRLILVDEVTAGFDPRTKREAMKLIIEMNRVSQITCLLTTHDLSDARSICDRLAVLHRGDVVAQGTWDEITSVSEAKLVVKGISRDHGERLKTVLSPRCVTETVGGFEIVVSSQSDGFKLAGLLERNGVQASSISFEVPPEEMFDKLTGHAEDDSTVS